MRFVTWSTDPGTEANATSTHQIVRRVLRAVHYGSIVLMHDGGGDQGATIRALPDDPWIRRMGLRLVAIPSRA